MKLAVSLLALAIQPTACGGSASPPSAPQSSPPASATAPSPSATPEPLARPATNTPPTTSANDAAGAARSTASGSPLERLMREHFKQAEQIRHAVISGKPKDAVQPALALAASVDPGTVPPAWQPSIQLMLAASNRVQSSADLAEAAAGTADIALACGSCHGTQGGPKLHLTEPPAVGDSVVSRMARHAWAMERLWEGLYVPSSAAWNAGARALQEDPFPKEVLERGGVYGRTAAADFRRLATQAAAKDSPRDRASVYSGLLGTCASCHLATGRGNN